MGELVESSIAFGKESLDLYVKPNAATKVSGNGNGNTVTMGAFKSNLEDSRGAGDINLDVNLWLEQVLIEENAQACAIF